MKTYLPHCFFLLSGVTLLCSCNTQTKFASSFGKRHYTKGFYWDRRKDVKQLIAANSVRDLSLMPGSAKIPQLIVNREKEINRNVAMPPCVKPIMVHKSNRVIASNAQTFAMSKAVPVINSHHHSDKQENTSGGALSIGGGIFAIACPIIFYLGIVMAILGTGGISAIGFILFGFFGDIVGVVLCIVALAQHDKYIGFAIAGLAFNILFYALLLSGAFEVM